MSFPGYDDEDALGAWVYKQSRTAKAAAAAAAVAAAGARSGERSTSTSRASSALQSGIESPPPEDEVCVAHGAKKNLCSHEGCTSQALKGGLCRRHGENSLATASSFEDLKRTFSCTTDSKMDQSTHAQTPLGVKPAPVSATPRPESTKAAIRSSVFGPNHEWLSSLAKLHILANDPSFNSIISWTDHGKSFMINRYEYQRRVMNVFFEQKKFKSFQNFLSRYRFKTVRTINGGTTNEYITYSHRLFTRDYLDIVAMMKLMAQSKMISMRSKTRLNDKTPIISRYGAAEE